MRSVVAHYIYHMNHTCVNRITPGNFEAFLETFDSNLSQIGVLSSEQTHSEVLQKEKDLELLELKVLLISDN